MSSSSRLCRVLILVALVTHVRVAYAQSVGLAHADPARTSAGLDARMGLAETPFPSPAAHEITGALTSLLVEGQRDIAPRLTVRVRLPLVLAAVDEPAGGAHPETAWGNAEAAAICRLRETAATVLRGRLAVAVPLPGGNADLGRRPLDNQALLLASAQRGQHDIELYAPGRVALTPAARLDISAGRVAVFGELKVPFMLAVVRGDRDPQTTVRPLAIASTAGAGASVSRWRLRAGLASWLTIDLLAGAGVIGAAPTPWTLTLDPAITIRIRERAHAGLAATVPIAGALSPVPAIGLIFAGAW